MTTREERLARLSRCSKDVLNGIPERNFVSMTQTKLGRGWNYLLFDPDPKDKNSRLETSVEGPGNPGFTIQSGGSSLRTGPRLEVNTNLSEVVWGEGKAVNPLFAVMPPNIVNFYPTMIPNLGDLTSLSKSLQGFMG